MDEIRISKRAWQSTFRGKCRGTARQSLPTWMTQKGFCLRCLQKRLQIFFQPSAGHDGSGDRPSRSDRCGFVARNGQTPIQQDGPEFSPKTTLADKAGFRPVFWKAHDPFSIADPRMAANGSVLLPEKKSVTNSSL